MPHCLNKIDLVDYTVLIAGRWKGVTKLKDAFQTSKQNIISQPYAMRVYLRPPAVNMSFTCPHITGYQVN